MTIAMNIINMHSNKNGPHKEGEKGMHVLICMIIQEVAGMCVYVCVCGGGGGKKIAENMGWGGGGVKNSGTYVCGPSVSAQQCCMHPLKVSSFSVELVVTNSAGSQACVAVELLCLLLNVPSTLFISSIVYAV